jgi:hypothetical protein
MRVSCVAAVVLAIAGSEAFEVPTSNIVASVQKEFTHNFGREAVFSYKDAGVYEYNVSPRAPPPTPTHPRRHRTHPSLDRRCSFSLSVSLSLMQPSPGSPPLLLPLFLLFPSRSVSLSITRSLSLSPSYFLLHFTFLFYGDPPPISCQDQDDTDTAGNSFSKLEAFVAPFISEEAAGKFGRTQLFALLPGLFLAFPQHNGCGVLQAYNPTRTILR